MNRKQMVLELVHNTNLDKEKALKFIRTFEEVVKEEIQKGEEIRLTGLGVFELRNREARVGRNPKTGEVIQIPAMKVAAFRYSNKIKDMVKLDVKPTVIKEVKPEIVEPIVEPVIEPVVEVVSKPVVEVVEPVIEPVIEETVEEDFEEVGKPFVEFNEPVVKEQEELEPIKEEELLENFEAALENDDFDNEMDVYLYDNLLDARLLLDKLKEYVPTDYVANMKSKEVDFLRAIRQNDDNKAELIKYEIGEENDKLIVVDEVLTLLNDSKDRLKHTGSLMLDETKKEINVVFQEFEEGIKAVDVEYLESQREKILEVSEYINTINLANNVINETKDIMNKLGSSVPTEVNNTVDKNLSVLLETIQKRKVSSKDDDLILAKGDSKIIFNAIKALLDTTEALKELTKEAPEAIRISVEKEANELKTTIGKGNLNTIKEKEVKLAEAKKPVDTINTAVRSIQKSKETSTKKSIPGFLQNKIDEESEAIFKAIKSGDIASIEKSNSELAVIDDEINFEENTVKNTNENIENIGKYLEENLSKIVHKRRLEVASLITKINKAINKGDYKKVKKLNEQLTLAKEKLFVEKKPAKVPKAIKEKRIKEKKIKEKKIKNEVEAPKVILEEDKFRMELIKKENESSVEEKPLSKKEKKKKEKEEKAKKEREAKAKAEKEAKDKAEQEAKEKAEKDAKAIEEREAKVKEEMEAKAKAEEARVKEEARLKAEEVKAKEEKEARAKEEREAKEKAEKEAKTKKEKEPKVKKEKKQKVKKEKKQKEPKVKEEKEPVVKDVKEPKQKKEKKQKVKKEKKQKEPKVKEEKAPVVKKQKATKHTSVRIVKINHLEVNSGLVTFTISLVMALIVTELLGLGLKNILIESDLIKGSMFIIIAVMLFLDTLFIVSRRRKAKYKKF